jgi:hypothetical protein
MVSSETTGQPLASATCIAVFLGASSVAKRERELPDMATIPLANPFAHEVTLIKGLFFTYVMITVELHSTIPCNYKHIK